MNTDVDRINGCLNACRDNLARMAQVEARKKKRILVKAKDVQTALLALSAGVGADAVARACDDEGMRQIIRWDEYGPDCKATFSQHPTHPELRDLLSRSAAGARVDTFMPVYLAGVMEVLRTQCLVATATATATPLARLLDLLMQ